MAPVVLSHNDDRTSVPVCTLPVAPATGFRRAALIVFSCVNVASIGVFFTVFVGLIAFPPSPRNLPFVLVVGSFGLAVLIMGQFVHWSRMALRVLRERRP